MNQLFVEQRCLLSLFKLFLFTSYVPEHRCRVPICDDEEGFNPNALVNMNKQQKYLRIFQTADQLKSKFFRSTQTSSLLPCPKSTMPKSFSMMATHTTHAMCTPFWMLVLDVWPTILDPTRHHVKESSSILKTFIQRHCLPGLCTI